MKTWTGVVMIERPDMTKTPHLPFSDGPMCLIRSARSLALDGRRAIVFRLPYRMVQHYFKAGAGDHAFAWAELVGEHIELRERASIREWAQTSHAGVH